MKSRNSVPCDRDTSVVYSDVPGVPWVTHESLISGFYRSHSTGPSNTCRTPLLATPPLTGLTSPSVPEVM